MLHFCDGFDSYTSTSDLYQKWRRPRPRMFGKLPNTYIGKGWEWVSNEGVNGGGCLKSTAGVELSNHIGIPFKQHGSQTINRRGRDLIWFKISAPPLVDTPFIQLFSEETFTPASIVNWTRLSLDLNTSGFLVQKRSGTSSAATIFTGVINVCDNAWHCIERQFFVSATATGEFRFVLDGVEVFNQVNIITGIGFPNLFLLRGIGQTVWIDDLIIWDDQQNDIDPTFDWNFAWVAGRYNECFPETGDDDFIGALGQKQITTIRPNAVGEISNFTPELNNYQQVDDVAHDEDTTYVQDNELGSRDVYNFEAMPPAATGIVAVVPTYQPRIVENGNVVMQPEAKQSADFLLGFRRLIIGRFVVKPQGPELITNGGPTFVDTTGWTAVGANTILSVEAGDLKILSTTTGTALARYSMVTEPGSRYYVLIKLSDILGGNASSKRIRAKIADPAITNWLVTFTDLEWIIEGSLNFIARTTETYIDISFATSLANSFIRVEYIKAGLEFAGSEYYLRQWAMVKDPTTLLPWTVADVDSAEFGMRISL